jgi:hypothetical protein
MSPNGTDISEDRTILAIHRGGITTNQMAEVESTSATFTDIVEVRVEEKKIDDVLSGLLAYSKRDAESIVRIWQRLKAIAMNGES